MSAFSKPDLTLLSPDGTEYEEDIGATATHSTEVDLDEKILSNLNPGITLQSASVFEVVAAQLLEEPGWRIQIKFKDSKTHFAVNGSTQKGRAASALDWSLSRNRMTLPPLLKSQTKHWPPQRKRSLKVNWH